MRAYYSPEIYISHEDLLQLTAQRKLRFGINQDMAERVTNSGMLPKGTSIRAAFALWDWVAVAVALGSIYWSFTRAWWWFLPGLFLASIIVKGTRKGNAENLMDLAMRDRSFYTTMLHLNVWIFQMEEADAQPYLIRNRVALEPTKTG